MEVNWYKILREKRLNIFICFTEQELETLESAQTIQKVQKIEFVA